MKIQLLPSSFDADGRAASEQRLTSFLIDDRVSVDAGSLAFGLSDEQRRTVRDVLITHTHIDHVAGLPLFIDDLFGLLDRPVRVHATPEVIHLLERDLFNWTICPRFSELHNGRTRVVEYVPFAIGEEFDFGHLRVVAVPVNHNVPTVGLIVSDRRTTVAFSSDTAETDEFWRLVNSVARLDALMIEASFPDAMREVAAASKHLTPATLERELDKLTHADVPVLAVHLKAPYREAIVRELAALDIQNLSVMEPGRVYEW